MPNGSHITASRPRLRSLAVVASLGIALAGTGIACTPALAATASSVGITSSTTSPTASAGSTTDAIAQQVIGEWQMIDMSFDESAVSSETEAQNAELAISMFFSMGFTMDVEFEPDGTYTLSMGSSMVSESQLDEMFAGGGETEETGTWYSDGEGVVLDDNGYAAFADDGTLILADSDGGIITLAPKADVEAGLFTPRGADTTSYLSDPDGFAYEWTLTAMRSEGVEFPIAMLTALTATDGTVDQRDDASASGSLVLDEDGTCSYTISFFGETQSEDGTWQENPDGTATLAFPNGTLTATIDDTGALVVSDAASASDASYASDDYSDSAEEQMVFRVVVDDGTADESASAKKDSAVSKAKASAQAAVSHSSADADKAASSSTR
ncbi:MAG: hypothetical protein SOI26_04665 [Coriobacteriales bacterium]|jgi:hypothetical protein